MKTFLCLSAVFVLLVACRPAYKSPDLGGLYNNLVQDENPYRNPVILIPGLLGSKLIDRKSQVMAWGNFGFAPCISKSGLSKKIWAAHLETAATSQSRALIISCGAIFSIVPRCPALIIIS